MSIYAAELKGERAPKQIFLERPVVLVETDHLILSGLDREKYLLASMGSGGFLGWNTHEPLVDRARFVRDPSVQLYGGEKREFVEVKDCGGYVSVIFGILLLGFGSKDQVQAINEYLAENTIQVDQENPYFNWR